MSESEKPPFLGLEGMLQDLGANSAKPKSAPPPPAEEPEPSTLEPSTLRKALANAPKLPPLPLHAYGRTSPVPPSADDAPKSAKPPPVDRGDPVSAIEPNTDVTATVAVEPPPPTEVSPATQPVSASDVEISEDGPKSALAKTRVSPTVAIPKPTEEELAAAKTKDVAKDEPAGKLEKAADKLVDKKSAPKKTAKAADPNARFPTLQALDDGADKPRGGMWFAAAAVVVALGLGWWFLRHRDESTTPKPTESAQATTLSASVAPPASVPSAPASAAVTASAVPSSVASVAASGSVAPPTSAAPSGTAATTATSRPTATAATGHATNPTTTATTTTRPTATATVTAPPTVTATTPPTATAPPTATTPPTSTKPSLINEP